MILKSGGVMMCFFTVQRFAVFRMALRYFSGKPAGGRVQNGVAILLREAGGRRDRNLDRGIEFPIWILFGPEADGQAFCRQLPRLAEIQHINADTCRHGYEKEVERLRSRAFAPFRDGLIGLNRAPVKMCIDPFAARKADCDVFHGPKIPYRAPHVSMKTRGTSALCPKTGILSTDFVDFSDDRLGSKNSAGWANPPYPKPILSKLFSDSEKTPNSPKMMKNSLSKPFQRKKTVKASIYETAAITSAPNIF